MRDANFFTKPVDKWQRKYEALRASFVERLPDHIVAERFGLSVGYLRVLRHQFRHEKIDFSEAVAEGSRPRRRIDAATRQKIVAWRQRELSAGDIAQLLHQEAVDISVRTIERILAEEGFKKLPRRTQLKIGRTIGGAEVPEVATPVAIERLEGQRFESAGAGVFLFAPFIAQLNLDAVIKEAKLPESKSLSATNYLFSILALKLLGTERYAHVDGHVFDPGLGLFAGLNVLPKCTALSTYSYSLDADHLLRLQDAFIRQVMRLALCSGSIINLDFHTIPHFGDESVLQ
jgi:transposase